jgi:hypothetical protein
MVSGIELARDMPRVLEADIRRTLDRLEQNNKVMVDGPNEGLEGVKVYEIVDEPGNVQEREGGKPGKRQVARRLVRGTGRQTAVHGTNYTVEWETQKRGKEGRGEVEEGAPRGRGRSEGDNGEDSEGRNRGLAPVLGGADAGGRGGTEERAGGGCAGEGSEGRGEACGKDNTRERGAGEARQAGVPGTGGCGEMSKSGGADPVGATPMVGGAAEYTMRTAPTNGTQTYLPHPEPTVEFMKSRHPIDGGRGMSKSGGATTNGAVSDG